jgi:molybdopterin molybdotransferase
MTQHDIRLQGFSDRAPLEAAWAWIDAQADGAAQEDVSVGQAVGRLLADPVNSPVDRPDVDRAAIDGYAVRAAECDGASSYNPLLLGWCQPGTPVLPPSAACPIAAGCPLPTGADALLPFEAAHRLDSGRTGLGADWLEVLAPVAVGAGIARRGCELVAGTPLLHRGRHLRPQDVACLAALGYTTVSVRRRPLVRLLVLGPKSGPDALTPLLLALLARDGALAELVPPGEALADLRGPDPVLIAGRSGAGPDDFAAASILACGSLALHGLTLSPGGSAGLGMLPRSSAPGSDAPVILLPGEPFACLVAYDMLAARLVRRLAGADTTLPYATAQFTLDRKIASAVGVTEIVPVRVTDGRAQPLSATGGMAAAVRADGFVIVPETSEGHPAGARVQIHLYGAP